MQFRILLCLAISVLLLPACFNDNRQDLYPIVGGCDTSNITYSGFVSPVMTSSCAIAGCHDATSAAGSIVLDNYNGVKTVATNGKLLPAITQTGPFPMPQGAGKLPECTISKISAWVAKGAPQN